VTLFSLGRARRDRLHAEYAEPRSILARGPGDARVRTRVTGLRRTSPIVSPHGHVPAEIIAENLHFANPSDLLVSRTTT